MHKGKYQCHVAALCCTYHQLKYSSPNRSKTKQEPHKRAYLSENGGLGKTDLENGPKVEKDTTEIATGLSIRTREEI